MTYKEFVNLYSKKDYINIDFKQKYIQKFFFEFTIKENNNIDNPSLNKIFIDKFKINLKLNLSELSHIRNKIVDNIKI